MATNRERWRNYNLWLLAPSGFFILTLVLAACGSDEQQTLEEKAQSIDKSLICPVCPSETIDQAQVELAQQMRLVVREKLAEGWTKGQIQQFFVDRYGEDVLAAPPKSGFSLLAWIVPPIGVFWAGVLLVIVVRAMRKGTDVTWEAALAPEQELEPYLAFVDKQMGLTAETASEPDDSG